jgi:polysaccharide biosynthesis protein PelG
MAGIGFRLKGYFNTGNVADRVKGSMFSVMISCGPWLMTIITIAAISAFAQSRITEHDLLVFRSIVSYTFGASLIFFGAIEMPLTRYLADKLFIDDRTSMKPLFDLVLMGTFLLGGLLGLGFYSFFNFDPWLTLGCIYLFSVIVCIWLAMVFLSAAKNFRLISLGFLLGNLLSFLLSWFWGEHEGLWGYVMGYVVGQSIVAVFLYASIQIEYSGKSLYSLEFLDYFRNHRRLVFIGTLYYSGIWIDKIVFWLTPSGRHVEGLFYTNPYYDTAMFLAYVTIIPAISIFFVNVETNFYIQYSYFFRSIDSKVNLPLLHRNRDGIYQSLKKSLANLLKFQTFITIIIWYFAEEIFQSLNLPGLMIPIFRYGVIGAYLQALFIFCNIILLYFLAEKEVLKNYGIFYFSNFLFSLVLAYGDFRYYGLGFCLSTFVTLVASFIALNKRLRMLEVHTFMEQPMLQKRGGPLP